MKGEQPVQGYEVAVTSHDSLYCVPLETASGLYLSRECLPKLKLHREIVIYWDSIKIQIFQAAFTSLLSGHKQN